MDVEDVKKSKYLSLYIEKMEDQILRMHPEWGKKQVKEAIQKMIAKRIQNPRVILDNNHTRKRQDTTLLSTFDWALTKKPLMAGNATFYKQHKECPNPDVGMVDGLLDDRKKLKKILFNIEDENSREYKDTDLFQGNKKRGANSAYGGSGSKVSPFYSKWTAISTTASAQAAISTTMTTFEAFIADTYIFITFNECIEWLHAVVHESVELDSWIQLVEVDQVYERIKNKCLMITKKQEKCLYDLLSSYTKEELARIYWKNNLIEFTEAHQEVKDIHNAVFQHIKDYHEVENVEDIPKEFQEKFAEERKPVKAWNTFVSVQKFYDPNKVPDTILEYLNALRDIYLKYVYVEFVHVDRIHRLKNFNRNCVTVIDTDSNILSLDTWMNFYYDKVLCSDYGRSSEDNDFAAVNTITYIIGAVVNKILLYFGECAFVDESIRPRYNMKNEFFFAKLFIATGKKKRYLSRIVLREGNRLTKPKYDVKGFDFKKAGVSADSKDFFMGIVKNDILSDKDIRLDVILDKLNRFHHDIRMSIKAGKTHYLPVENPKELDAYADPSEMQGVRGVLTWNFCEPDNMIELPSSVYILKLDVEKEEDLLPLKKDHPEIYQRLIDGIFHDKTKIFVKRKKNSKGVFVDECCGMNVIAIPRNSDIPEYLQPLIDYRTITNKILSPFNSVLETFNIPGIDEGKTGRKTTGLSNLIRL